jgi:CRP/FNR family transcriptional regulator, cyclic AMP receptor protein
VPLFGELEEDELAKLADQVSFKSGEAIFHEYDQGDALYVVESGAVRIWVHDDDVQQITFSELKPGDFFGELSILDKGERSANATAIMDSTLHRLNRDDFHEFMLKHPHCHRFDLRDRGATATNKPACLATCDAQRPASNHA